jgi:hypothetical protein
MTELISRLESFHRMCESLDMPDGLPDWIAAHLFTVSWPGYWDELVDADTGERPAGTLRWVRRNVDKPHRCPVCHRVVTWRMERYGPRTRLSCTKCGVQWRSGVRVYPWPVRILRRR